MSAPPQSQLQQPDAATLSSRLRRVYGDICRGYSSGTYRGKTVFIKHLTPFEQSEADQYYDEYFVSAQNRGIPSRENRLKWLCDRGLWSQKQEIEIKRQKDYLDALHEGLTKIAFKVQIEAQKKTIADEQARYNDLVSKREKLFDLTAEAYASNKLQFYYVYLSFYRDEALRKRLYTLGDINELDDEDSYDLLGYYIGFIEDFSHTNIRRISVAPYFLEPFYLCGENVTQFFGKPMVELSGFQTRLLSSGSYFKSIMAGEKIPAEIRNNPDKIEAFVNQAAAIKERIAKNGLEGGSTGLVGASSEDFKAAGVRDDRSFLRKETNLMQELKLM